ncbi:MAG: beta-ketoacyl-ACP synthase II [Ardenticatenales bacterium]|nr:beta-ketoacyl-ACP synthase II [Ardenticatenales bacterium]
MNNNGYGRRVVVTGLGTVNPLGNNVESTWQALLQGKRVVRRIERFDPVDFLTKIGAQVSDFDIGDYEHLVSKKEARRMDLNVVYSLAASAQAMEDAELRVESNEQGDRYGNLIGTGIGGLETIFDSHKTLLEKGPMRVSPFTATYMLPNMASGVVGVTFNLRGPSYAIVSACATGTHVIGECAEIIRRGDADVMLAGGTEAPFTPFGMAAFHRTTALTQRNDDPERASRPFDRDRDGFVIGEGAATLVLESLEHAQQRGATILGEVVGYGMSTDAYHLTAPPEGGEGAARAMRLALKKAGLRPEDIDYINAHGTSTLANDKEETAAIKTVFGDYAYKVPISSSKSMTGHLLGAAGALEGVVAIKTILEGKIHPTVNLDNPDVEHGCDLDYVPNTVREQKVRTVMSNSFGFGGHNATIIIKEFEG